MVRKGVATTAIVAVVVVVLIAAGVFGYMYLMSSNQTPSTTQNQGHPNIPASTSQAVSSTSQGNLKISNAALSNGSLLVTIQNTGSQAVALDSILVSPGSGCLSSVTSTTTSQTSQNRSGFALPACFAQAAIFVVQSNSTLRPVAAAQFNFTRPFNSTSRTFSGNFSRTFSGNFSRTISGNFSRGFPGGNFSAGFPGFGNFSGLGGFQLAAGQAVTLAYSGPIGSGVTTGSQYTITVTGLQAAAQITLSAS